MTNYPTPIRDHLALGAVAGPLLFTLSWVGLGFVSPGYTLYGHHFTSYEPISQPISGLGMGATAPYMNAAFIATGLMLTIGVVAAFQSFPPDRPVLRRWSMALLACTGLGQVICGSFDLESTMPHSSGFFLAAGTPLVGFPVAGWYLRQVVGWRRLGTGLLVLASPLTLALLVGFFATFQPTADGAEHGVAGLVQRVLILQVHAWFVAIGWCAYQRGKRRHSPPLSAGSGQPGRATR